MVFLFFNFLKPKFTTDVVVVQPHVLILGPQRGGRQVDARQISQKRYVWGFRLRTQANGGNRTETNKDSPGKFSKLFLMPLAKKGQPFGHTKMITALSSLQWAPFQVRG